MKTNDIITGKELTSIIKIHGAGHVSIDGGHFQKYEDAASLEMDGNERFQVVINYGYPVQFHLITKDDGGDDTIDGEQRAIVTTGLKGRCEGLEWMA